MKAKDKEYILQRINNKPALYLPISKFLEIDSNKNYPRQPQYLSKKNADIIFH
jgi:hypothetical protein